MGFQPSGDTTTQVTLDINLTKLGREKLVYGTGSRVSYFTLHDEGINYTSSVKPTRGNVADVAGTLSSNKGVYKGQGFKDVIMRQVPTGMEDLITQTGTKKVKFGVSSRGWGGELGMSADTESYNKLNVTVNLDYALNFMKWLSEQIELGQTIDYSIFYDTNNHPASTIRDGFLDFIDFLDIETDDESTQKTLDTEKDEIDVCFLNEDTKVFNKSTSKYSSDIQKYVFMSKEMLYSNGGSPVNVSYQENAIDSPFKFAFSSGRENIVSESVHKLTANPPQKKEFGKLYGGAGKWGITLGMSDYVYGIRRKDWHKDGINGNFDGGIIAGQGQRFPHLSSFDMVNYNDGNNALNTDLDYIAIDPTDYEGRPLPTSITNKGVTVPLYLGQTIEVSKNRGFYPRTFLGSYSFAVPLLEMCSFGSQVIAVQNDIIETFFRRTSTTPYNFTNLSADTYQTTLTFVAKPRTIKSTRANPVKDGLLTVTFKYNKSIAEGSTIDWGKTGDWATSYNYNNFVVREKKDYGLTYTHALPDPVVSY